MEIRLVLQNRTIIAHFERKSKLVVNWDHPIVKEKTREIEKALAEEFEKSGKFKNIEEHWEDLKDKK